MDQESILLHMEHVGVAIIHVILVAPIEYAQVVMLQLTSVSFKVQVAFQCLVIMKDTLQLLLLVELVVQGARNFLTVKNVN